MDIKRLEKLAELGDQAAQEELTRHLAKQGEVDTWYKGKRHRFELSTYQKAVVDWLVGTMSKAAVVIARAGSGKTSLILTLLSYLSSKVLVLAFSNVIKEELAKKTWSMEHAKISTCHGAGFGAIRKTFRPKRCNVQQHKYRDWIRDKVKEIAKFHHSPSRQRLAGWQLDYLDGHSSAFSHQVTRVMSIAMSTLRHKQACTADGVAGLCWDYDIDMDIGMHGLASEIIDKAFDYGFGEMRLGHISFEDMIFWPAVDDRIQPYTYSYVFVDEAQDLSAAQLMVAIKSRSRNGRLLFVGDPRQAIFGFAGAQCDSIKQIIEKTQALQLPLSICYRCPKSHIRIAQQIVPDIEAAPDAIEGEVRAMDLEQMAASVKEGDLIMCRKNAPLLGVCFQLIARGVSARVKGRDIGERLVSLFDQVVKHAEKNLKGATFVNFPDALTMLRGEQISAILEKNGNDLDDVRIASVMDRFDCLTIIRDASGADTLDGMRNWITELFSNNRPSVWLSSIHRAKGLEADSTYILNYSQMPMSCTRDWQREQEENLMYVALTRSTRCMTFVEV